MTARAEAATPATPETRQHMTEHADELHALAGLIETTRDELRADGLLGYPIELPVLGLLGEAADLITIAARRTDPNHQETRS